jgi:thiamine-phosphate pyrophosphorylase
MREELISYLITDPKYYSNDKNVFEKNIRRVLKIKKVDIACFRDKESENFKELAKVFVKVCKEFNIDKILINGNYKLAKKLDASGVHLTSQQFEKIKKAKELDLFTIISCHNYDDIEKAQNLYVDAIAYSPIFHSPNKGEPKGIDKLKEATRIYEDIHIIALGGIIDEEHVEKISKTKAYGFASIRYFI